MFRILIFLVLGVGVGYMLRGRSFGKAFFSLVGIGLLSFVPYLAWVYVDYRLCLVICVRGVDRVRS